MISWFLELICQLRTMKKVRACLEVAFNYIRKPKHSTARELNFVQKPEPIESDEEDEEEDLPEVIPSGPLVVRSISGKIMHSQDMTGDGLRVADIVDGVCQNAKAREDEVRIMAGEMMLDHNMVIGHGDCIAHPGPGKTLELSLALVPGAPLTAHASSGSEIDVLEGVPECGEDCHVDRDYVFISLGDFADAPGMRYVMTSNDDRKTPANKVMWQLDIREPSVVFLNFRSKGHVQNGGAQEWLKRDGWELKPDFKSTVSSGYPNGPYAGPVYAKSVRPCNRKYVVDLWGSSCWEGTYFVFVQVETSD